MKVAVTGANGFLGQHLCAHLSANGHAVTGVGRGISRIPTKYPVSFFSVGLTDAIAVERMIDSVRPDVIVHAAAMSKPDECDSNREACLLHNVEATKHLLASFKTINSDRSQFIHISTDFVFGDDGPHGEDDEKRPLNFYGQSKLMAEEAVGASGLAYAIVRPVFIYGPVQHGLRGSFLHWVKNSISQNKHIKVVSDQYRTPTFVQDICKGIEQIIVHKKHGVYHLAGKEVISPYQMAVATAAVLGLDATLIEEVTSDTFIEPVKRAKRGGLKIDKAIRELGHDPVSFEEGIRLTFNLT